MSRAKGRCICGCGQKSRLQRHHVVYVQELRRVADQRDSEVERAVLFNDPRNLVTIGHGCHAAHHSRARPLPMWVLPDSVFEFASEVLGREAAYEYLARRYRSGDSRHTALLESEAA